MGVARSPFKMGIHLRCAPPDARSDNPGPGAYDHPVWSNDFSRPEQPKIGFCKAERSPWPYTDGPGPGAYEPVDYMFSRTPAVYTFGAHHQHLKRADTNNGNFVTASQFWEGASS